MGWASQPPPVPSPAVYPPARRREREASVQGGLSLGLAVAAIVEEDHLVAGEGEPEDAVDVGADVLRVAVEEEDRGPWRRGRGGEAPAVEAQAVRGGQLDLGVGDLREVRVGAQGSLRVEEERLAAAEGEEEGGEEQEAVHGGGVGERAGAAQEGAVGEVRVGRFKGVRRGTLARRGGGWQSRVEGRRGCAQPRRSPTHRTGAGGQRAARPGGVGRRGGFAIRSHGGSVRAVEAYLRGRRAIPSRESPAQTARPPT